MEKNLLTEIHRIQELMGGKQTYLNEQAALIKQLLKKTKGLTDEFMSLFKNADIELDNLRQVGTKNAKGEIINAPDNVLDDLYRKVDMDKFVSKLKNTVLAGLNQYEVTIQKQILDELVKGNSITDEMIQSFKELYKIELDKIPSLDGVPTVNAKLVDDFEKSIREFVNKNKPAPKRFTSELDVKKLISSDLNVPLEKLMGIKGVSPILSRAAREMNGKTIEEVAKKLGKVLDEIQYKPEFEQFSKRLGKSFFQRVKDDIVKIIEVPERKYIIFGDAVIDPTTGEPVKSLTRSGFKAIRMLLLSYLFIKAGYYWLLESREFGASFSKAFNDAYFSILTGIFGEIGEYRDEQGDLTIDESKELFEPTLKQLGKKQTDFVPEKISRGVVKFVDFSEENAQDYVIVKEAGEVSIYPWTDDMNNMDWSDLGGESWKLIKSRVENLLN